MESLESVAGALKQLEATPRILRTMIADLSETQSALKPSPSSFSVAETVTHLLHVEKHCYEDRIGKILGQDDPRIAMYDAKMYEAAGAYGGMTAAAALDAFSSARSKNLATLNAISAERFSRRGAHETVGKFTLAELINECAAHDLGHIRQIAIIMRDTLYVPAMGAFRD